MTSRGPAQHMAFGTLETIGIFSLEASTINHDSACDWVELSEDEQHTATYTKLFLVE